LTNQIVKEIEIKVGKNIPDIETIQDVVEQVLIKR
jgi:hypothetical protein